MRGGVAISVTATPVAAPRRSMEVLRIINKPSGLRLRLPMGPDRRVPVLPELQIDYGLACIARLEQAPMPERLHYLYLRSFSRKREISEGRVRRHSVTRFRDHLFWRVILQAGHRFRGPTGKMMQSFTCLDMELTRFHSNLR